METRRALVLAPPDPTSWIKILLDKMATFLEMIDSFDAIAPPQFLSQDLGFLYVNPFLSNKMLSHFQHHHWVLVRVRWIEVIWRGILELCYSLLPPHFSLLSLLARPVSCGSVRFGSFALVKRPWLLPVRLEFGFGNLHPRGLVKWPLPNPYNMPQVFLTLVFVHKKKTYKILL